MSLRDCVLTFDDGPELNTTGRLLDILAKHAIKAMFFVLGQQLTVSEQAALVRRAHAEGHVIGNHSFSHLHLGQLSQPQVREELRRAHDLICECVGSCAYFRPPFGESGPYVAEALEELRYTQVLWNVDALDYKLQDKGAWVDHALDGINRCQDCVVLMHDIHQSTVAYLDTLIERIRLLQRHRFTLGTSSMLLATVTPG